MKNYTVRTIPESNRNMIETEPRSTPIAHIYMTSQIFWPRTVASIKRGVLIYFIVSSLYSY